MTTKKGGSDNSEEPVFDHTGHFFSDKNAYKLIMQQPTYATVWDILSKIDCSDKVEKKNGLSYLSWAWAWGIMMEHFPQATYEFLTEEFDDAGTCTVWCRVKIADNYEDIRYTTLERTMWLPVMDYKNKAIAHPDSRAISDTRMRCLTKCLAMYGLGHYIYAGEDLPAQTEPVTEEKPPPKKTAAKKAPPKKADNVVKMTEVKTAKEGQDYINSVVEVGNFGDEDECENFVDFLLGHIDAFHSASLENLSEFYRNNTKVYDLVDGYSDDQYKVLSAHMSALKKALNNQGESNE